MADKPDQVVKKPDEDARRESGEPGGGQGRTDVVGRTGVWPGKGPWPPGNVPIQQPGSFGQGERGAAGYEDTGPSSLEGVEEIIRQQKENAHKEKEKPTRHE